MHESIEKLRQTHGNHQASWTWGQDHSITYTHPFGYIPVIGAMFNIGPFQAPGGSQTINNLLHPHGTFDHKIIAGPSTRRIIDFTNPEHSHTILPTGNSGHWLDPHYKDQAEMYIQGKYRDAALTRQQIATTTAHLLNLIPQ
jgi:penicillin amidase